jgi:aminopeptidase N
MRTILFLILLLSAAGAFGQNLRSGGSLKPEQANMDIRHYTINLDVDPVAKSIKGFTEIQLVLITPASVMLIDLWHGLQVSEVRVDGTVIPFKHGDDDIIRMESAKSWPAGKHMIKVNYGGIPGVAERAPWTGGFQWSTDTKGNPWVAITCQSEGGKIFFPCKDHPSDEPNEGADLWITVPKGLVAVGPGLLIGSKNAGSKTTWHWKTNYTISNYCLVFNIGKYTVVRRPYTSVAGTKIPMEFYILEEDAAKGPHMLEMLERTTRILEKYFRENGHGVRPAKCGFTRDAFEQQTSQRKNIGSGVDFVCSIRLLGSHISKRPHQRSRAGHARRRFDPRDTEIEHPDGIGLSH